MIIGNVTVPGHGVVGVDIMKKAYVYTRRAEGDFLCTMCAVLNSTPIVNMMVDTGDLCGVACACGARAVHIVGYPSIIWVNASTFTDLRPLPEKFSGITMYVYDNAVWQLQRSMM